MAYIRLSLYHAPHSNARTEGRRKLKFGSGEAHVRLVFRQRLRANSQFMLKMTKSYFYLHSNVHIKNGLNTAETEIST